VTPSVASALIWVWIFNPDFGIMNGLLDSSVSSDRSGSTIQ